MNNTLTLFDSTRRNDIMYDQKTIIQNTITILTQLLDALTENTTHSQNTTAEMITVKDCAKLVDGLSEHTIRKLVAQKKIPYIRAGAGERGKILINKALFLDYIGGAK